MDKEKRGTNSNIFAKGRNTSSRRDTLTKEEEKKLRKQIDEIDKEYEKQYIEIMNNEDWNELYELSN